jgi:hypothetical protein
MKTNGIIFPGFFLEIYIVLAFSILKPSFGYGKYERKAEKQPKDWKGP